MKRTLYVPAFLPLVLVACGIAPAPVPTATFTALPPPPAALMTTAAPPTQAVLWQRYNNRTYGYSLEYPSTLDVAILSDEYVEIGPKIVLEVWDIDPAAPLGDGPLVESVTEVELAGHPARLFTGYIGSVGGYVPQQFKRFVVQRDRNYFLITLYALGLHDSGGDVTKIAPLDAPDVELFDTISASLRFP